jgi:hypothetical protein
MKTLLNVLSALGVLMVILPFAFTKETYAQWQIGARAKLQTLSEAAGEHAAATWTTITSGLVAFGVFISHHLSSISNVSRIAVEQHKDEVTAAIPTIALWVTVIIGIPLAYVVVLFLVHIACRIMATFDKGVVAGFGGILAFISQVLKGFVES